VLILPILLGAFRPPGSHHRAGPLRFSPGAENQELASILLYFEGYEDIRTAIAREKRLKGWRRPKKINLIRTINPEFKDLAQTWEWKMITVHERIYP
jgi:predicted GIY-YIG superfamily endonuclease